MRSSTLRSARWLIVAATVSQLACVASRPYLGDVNLRRYTNTSGSPYTFGVEGGRIVSPDLDIAMGPDGCARGQFKSSSYVLCQQEVKEFPGVPLTAGETATRWNGDGGDFITRIAPDGSRLRVDGRIRMGPTDRQLHVTLVLEKGPQWDELRKDPVLLAIAAAAIGMNGEPADYTIPSTNGSD